MPAAIHAGGLRYHGASPLVSQLVQDKLIEARAYDQLKTYEAGILFARIEGQIPAPETCHAIAAAIDEAKLAKEEGIEKTILFNYSGHGLLDLTGYSKYLEGDLAGFALPEEEISRAIAAIADLPRVGNS
jgi:tryptophan synthase beta chain